MNRRGVVIFKIYKATMIPKTALWQRMMWGEGNKHYPWIWYCWRCGGKYLRNSVSPMVGRD